MPSLTLRVHCDSTAPGDTVAALGSWNAWDKSRPTKLATTPATFPSWTASIQLPTSTPIEYKYAIIRNGNLLRWEHGIKGANRHVNFKNDDTQLNIDDFFDTIPRNESHRNNAIVHKKEHAQPNWASNGVSVNHSDTDHHLDTLESAILHLTATKRSWRQRLSFIRSLFTDPQLASSAAFNSSNIDHLATLSIYLTFLASGQVRCEEDGGHHRPNHHANEARLLEAALARVIQAAPSKGKDAYIPYVVRKIFPQLPSYAPQFTASVPLTRIRDIAHRSDIPHDFKQEIKHTLQNKLHRCAGPEDLHTSARLLERIQNGDYSHGLKEQFAIFHAELLDFFNASSLDDRLRYLQANDNTKPVASLAGELLRQKHERQPALPQMETLTKLRTGIGKLPLMQKSVTNDQNDLPCEDVQRTRLADIDLEGYAFMLLAGVAKDAEQQQEANFDWKNALDGLSLSLDNIALSGVCPAETKATGNELLAALEETSNEKLLRGKAAVDRALRFAESFSESITDVFTRRATSIGLALGVDRHAVDVFAEAEIRSNITFQASRIADACARTCRKVLSLPPWDPLYAGEARGKLVFTEHLADLCDDESEDVIAVCREAEGDEDIPSGVRAVVLGRSLPHLSHLGVRARQAGVVFVCAEEREAFEKLWRERNLGHVWIDVNHREGLKPFSKLQGDDITSTKLIDNKSNKKQAPKRNIKITFDGELKKPISVIEATASTASSKCAFVGKLRRLGKKSDGIFETPNGMALPHGVFQMQCSKFSGEYRDLIKSYSESAARGESGDAAQALSRFITSKFELAEQHCKQIQARFHQGTKVMVRSSANAEDLEDMSGAGLYDSISNVQVHSTEALRAAVCQVWASLWTKRAASSRTSYGVPHNEASMAVLIQEMIAADLSFVAFSHDPVSKSSEHIYVEVATGMGETLASAASAGTPYRFRVERGSLHVNMISFASYSEALVPNDSADGLTSKLIDYSKERMTTSQQFRTQLVQRIAKAIILLENEFGGPQDAEGAVTVTREQVGVHVVQARPQIL